MQTAAASAQPRSRAPISPGALGTVTGRMKSSRVALRADAIAAETVPANATSVPTTSIPTVAVHQDRDASVPRQMSTEPTRTRPV